MIALCTALVGHRNLVITGRTAVIAERSAAIQERTTGAPAAKTELELEAEARKSGVQNGGAKTVRHLEARVD